MSNKAIVLFCEDIDIAEIQSWLSESNTDHVSSASLIIVVNASDVIANKLDSGLQSCEILELQGTFLPALFKAKSHIDCKTLVIVNVVCSYNNAVYIERLCKELFTPIYTWHVIPIGAKQTDPRQLNNINIGKDLELFLSSLPGDGDIFTLQSDLIPGDIFHHGFSTRPGGLSTVPGLRSLNMVYSAKKHDPAVVIADHQRRLAQKAGFDVKGLQVVRSVHGNTVHVIGKEPPGDGYDGIVTDLKGKTCAAAGADCIPMVFADPVTRACGAIHSGWKGTVARICVETLRIMNEHFGSRPEDILVAMGPSICEKCFEFGVDDSKQFEQISQKCILYKSEAAKPTIDLKLANRVLLQENGVKPENIDDKSVSLCTMENPELFFSYRRDGRPFGSQIGFIGIK